MSNQNTAESCFKQIQPILDEVMKMMTGAPLEGKEVVPFHVYVAAYFIGVAIATMQQSKPELKERPLHDVANDLMDLIVQVLKKQGLN